MKTIRPIFWGIIAALGALVLETLISLFTPEKNISKLLAEFSWLLFASAAAEEFLKLTIVYKIFQELEFPKKIIGQSLLIGVGFSAAEIFFNFYKINGFEKTAFLFLAGLVFVHLFTSLLAGWVLFKKSPASYLALSEILILNIAIHLAYNLAILRI